MRYLVTTLNHSPFLTDWFDPENLAKTMAGKEADEWKINEN